MRRGTDDSLAALAQLCRAVGNASSLNECLNLAVEQAALLSDAQRSLILLVDETGTLRIRAQHGLAGVANASFAEKLIATDDPQLTARIASAIGSDRDGVLVVPLLAMGHVTGLLAVGPSQQEADAASDAREDILAAIATQIGGAVECTRLAAELREGRRLAETVERATGVGAITWNIITGVRTWSPEVYRLHGIDPSLPPAHETWQATVHPDDYANTPADDPEGYARLHDRAPYTFREAEYRVLLPDRSLRWLCMRTHIVLDDQGRPAEMLGVSFDVTARKRAEEARRASEERFRLATAESERAMRLEREARVAAEAATRQRDHVLNAVAHELASPLSTIGMCAHMLGESGYASLSERVRPVDLIERCVASMHRMITDLRDVASIETGHLALEIRAEAPAVLLASAADMFAATARGAGVHQETHASPDLPAVRADAERVLQVLSNLLANAIGHTTRGGRVTLSAEPDPAGVRFAVEDTGSGITIEDLPHVFDRFWHERGGAHHGSGLGLPIVRGIVEAHGGSVDVRSTAGQGSRFSFTIPAAG